MKASFKYYSALLLIVASAAHANHGAFSWKGPYLGAYIGGAWGQSNFDTDAGSITGSSYYISNDDIHSVNKSGSSSPSSSAFIGGVQFGNNFVIHNWVLGLVLDYGSLTLNTEETAQGNYPSGAGSYSEKTSVETDWLYTMRARIGYVPMKSNPFLVYVTGGLALTNPTITNELSDTSSLSGTGGASNDSVQAGWTIGAGLEYPIYQHITVSAEYLYVQFNSVEVDSTITNGAGGFGILPNSLNSPFTTSADLYANLFKVGLNYKF